jgi:ABC-2 type transport system permease protein
VLALADVPGWLLGLSPFHHVALVPAESVDAVGAAVMAAIGAAAAVAAVELFQRRDLIAG